MGKSFSSMTQEERSAELQRYDQGILAASIFLGAASKTGVIAETKLGNCTLSDWEKLSEEEQSALLHPGGTEQVVAEMAGEQIKRQVRPSQKRVLEAACKLAGTTYEAARARLLDDTPERRRQARLETGI